MRLGIVVDLGKRDQNRPRQSKATRRGPHGPVWGAPHWSSFRRLMTTAHGIPHRNSPKPSDSRGLTPRPAVRERGRWHRQGPPTAWENGGSAVLQVGPQPRRRPPTPLLSTLSCLLSRPQAAGGWVYFGEGSRIHTGRFHQPADAGPFADTRRGRGRVGQI